MKTLSRRTFVTSSAMAVTGACLCGIGGCATITGIGDTPAARKDAYLISGNRISVDLDRIPELKKVGDSVKIRDERLNDNLIIVQTEQDTYIVSSIHCTHRGTEVEYEHENSRFKCASIGGSEFQLDGTVISGPAKGNLKGYKSKTNGKILTVML